MSALSYGDRMRARPLRRFADWFFDGAAQIRTLIAFSAFLYLRVPLVGRSLSRWLDCWLRILFGMEVCSFSIHVKHLQMAHSVGCVLGGNGIRSDGRVIVMAGVIFGAKHFDSPSYREAHKTSSTFCLGDNIVLCSHAILLGPLSICDNVVVAAGAIVRDSIQAPGVYAGNPARKVADYSDWMKCADHVFG